MRITHRYVLLLALLCLCAAVASADALRDYVYNPDPHSQYRVVTTVKADGYTTYVLDMTSQSWHAGDVQPHVWQHWLTVVVPDLVSAHTALLYITGGNNKHDKPPEGPRDWLVQIALTTRTITAELRGVPSEPVTFSDETRTRSEDEIIAYTFAKFRDTGDPTWPLLLPMVKSAVAAMDTVQHFAGGLLMPAIDIDGFVVTGASKRGWTTWLTAAAAPDRVIAIAPMVIDVLNMKPQMEHQLECYGAYSSQIEEYTQLEIQDMLATKDGDALREIVDPYSYRRRLKMPKLVLLGSGDDYWTVDAAQFYFPHLRGTNHIRYQPNAGHGLGDREQSIHALTAFYHGVLRDDRLPRFSWKQKRDGSFKVKAKDVPKQVRVWKAYSNTRDFRMDTIGEAWTSEVVPSAKKGVYEGRIPMPASGYVAYFVELVYPSGLGFEYSLTTLTSVPDRK